MGRRIPLWSTYPSMKYRQYLDSRRFRAVQMASDQLFIYARRWNKYLDTATGTWNKCCAIIAAEGLARGDAYMNWPVRLSFDATTKGTAGCRFGQSWKQFTRTGTGHLRQGQLKSLWGFAHMTSWILSPTGCPEQKKGTSSIGTGHKSVQSISGARRLSKSLPCDRDDIVQGRGRRWVWLRLKPFQLH